MDPLGSGGVGGRGGMVLSVDGGALVATRRGGVLIGSAQPTPPARNDLTTVASRRVDHTTNLMEPAYESSSRFVCCTDRRIGGPQSGSRCVLLDPRSGGHSSPRAHGPTPMPIERRIAPGGNQRKRAGAAFRARSGEHRAPSRDAKPKHWVGDTLSRFYPDRLP